MVVRLHSVTATTTGTTTVVHDGCTTRHSDGGCADGQQEPVLHGDRRLGRAKRRRRQTVLMLGGFSSVDQEWRVSGR